MVEVGCPHATFYSINSEFCTFSYLHRCIKVFLSGSRGVALRGIRRRFGCSLTCITRSYGSLAIGSYHFTPGARSFRVTSLTSFVRIYVYHNRVSIRGGCFSNTYSSYTGFRKVRFVVRDVSNGGLAITFGRPRARNFGPVSRNSRVNCVDAGSLLRGNETAILSSGLASRCRVRLRIGSASTTTRNFTVRSVAGVPAIRFGGGLTGRVVAEKLLVAIHGGTIIRDGHFRDYSVDNILLSSSTTG